MAAEVNHFKAERALAQHDPRFVRVIINAGQSPDSLQFSGFVVLRPEEADDFLDLVNGPFVTSDEGGVWATERQEGRMRMNPDPRSVE